VNERHKEKKRRNKIRAIEYLGGKCHVCNNHFPDRPEVFDFHHIDPSEKERKAAEMLANSWTIIQKELDKCVLLCGNCHRTEHARIRRDDL
jgi:hypothetical protein